MPGGPVDTLRTGIPGGAAESAPAPPFQERCESGFSGAAQAEAAHVRSTYGAALPIRLATEAAILSQTERLPGLPSSRLGLEAMSGKLDRFDETDYLGPGADLAAELTPPPQYSVVEQRLGLNMQAHSRGFL